MTGGGQIWAWQLAFSFLIFALGASPWHLFWLGPVSIALSIIVSSVWRGRMLSARYTRIDEPEALQKASWIEVTAAGYLEDDMAKQAFSSFIEGSPALKRAFHDSWGRVLSPEHPLTRGRLTLIFNDVGIKLAKSGDSDAARRSLACSSLFIKGSPLAWAANAEVSFARQDRVAARWAEKVVGFRLQKNVSSELREFLTTDEARALLRDAKERMRQIIDTCQSCVSWNDTSAFVDEAGLAKSYFDQ